MKSFRYIGTGTALQCGIHRLLKGETFTTDDPRVIETLEVTKDVEEVKEKADKPAPTKANAVKS